MRITSTYFRKSDFSGKAAMYKQEIEETAIPAIISDIRNGDFLPSFTVVGIFGNTAASIPRGIAATERKGPPGQAITGKGRNANNAVRLSAHIKR